jgi:hypothetical protein
MREKYSMTNLMEKVLEEMQRILREELGGRYNEGLETAGDFGDRGVLRALTWGKNPRSAQAAVIHYEK